MVIETFGELLYCYSHKPIFSRGEVAMKIAEEWFWEEKVISGSTIVEKGLRALESKA